MSTSVIERGTIKLWKMDRGFGFIKTTGGAEIFAHVTEVQDGCQPTRGDRVEFVTGVGRDGRPSARNIKIIGGRK